MALMATYKATVTKDGRSWLVYVPAVERYTQARNLRELDAMTADLIEVMTGEHLEAVDYDIQLPAEVKEHLEAAERYRATMASARSQAAAEVRAAARALHESGVPLRDIGKLLGVTYQRAHQLVA
ncbi:MAG: type II toxin-antitoxin system HicB family antitoxin [Acidimicrobiales bacterium]